MDPLDKLFTSDKEVDPELLSGILLPYIQINSEDYTIFFTDSGNNLPINSRIIIFLLARKALYIKGKIDSEAITPKDIIDQTQLKEGSVQPGLKKLKEGKFIISKDGKYFVPNYAINKAKDLVQEKK